MYFTFNGTSSKDFGLKVKSSTHLSSPAKKIELIEIPGRTGSLVIDDGSYKNQTITVVCLVDARDKKNLHTISRQLKGWLQAPIGYQDLVFSDGLSFKAICSNQLDISEIALHYGQVSITFSAVEV